MKPTCTKSWAGNLLVWSDLTLGLSFELKQAQSNLKVLITCLLLVLEVCNVKSTYKKLEKYCILSIFVYFSAIFTVVTTC